MSRTRSRQPLTPIDMVEMEHTSEPETKPLKKLDFSASTRKKAQTPKKRAAFTPLKIQGDTKPKLEPESPTVAKPKRTIKRVDAFLQPKVEPEEEAGSAESAQQSVSHYDEAVAVKPDISELEGLLGGLDLEATQTLASPHRLPQSSPLRRDDRHQPNSVTRRPTSPLFMPFDSPAQPASPQSIKLSPKSASASPLHDRRSPEPQTASGKIDPFDLFSSDSPPPPIRQVSRSYSVASSWRGSMSRDLSDEEAESPTAGPSKRQILRSRSSSNASSTSDIKDQVRGASPAASSSSSYATATEASLPVLQPTQTPARQRRRAFLDFLDTVAKTADVSEDDYGFDPKDDEEESLGSLRDFIVDDDEITYLSDSSGIEHDMISEAEDSDIIEVKPVVKGNWSIDLSDDDSDIMVEEAVSHPKVGKGAGLGFLREFHASDSDGDEKIGRTSSDAEDDLLDAIDNLAIGVTPATANDKSKVSSKAKGKKGAKAPKWAIQRVQLAQEVFDDLDKRVFDSKLGPNGAGAKIIWNKRLLTTAGTAQRKRRRLPGGETSWEVAIQLSEKVCTGEEQVLSTVAHEMCHLACWVIDNEFKNPHGKVFKSWGRKVMRKRDDLEVTTKHDYIIEFKYHWKCIDCKKVYKRHSKSIDIEKQGCGVCKGKLEALFATKSRGTSNFQVYLKQNMSLAKAALPGASHGEVMRALSARWTEAGSEADHEAHWKAVLVATRA